MRRGVVPGALPSRPSRTWPSRNRLQNSTIPKRASASTSDMPDSFTHVAPAQRGAYSTPGYCPSAGLSTRFQALARRPFHTWYCSSAAPFPRSGLSRTRGLAEAALAEAAPEISAHQKKGLSDVERPFQFTELAAQAVDRETVSSAAGRQLWLFLAATRRYS